MKILIGIPYTFAIEEKCLKSVENLKQMKDFDFELCALKNSFLAEARNIFIKKDYDFFLSLDSDHAFDNADFMKMMDTKEPLLFGAYPSKTHKRQYEAGSFLKDYPGVIDKRVGFDDTNILTLDWSAAGFMIMSKEFANEIGGPWFRCPDIKTPEGFDVPDQDLGFCLKLRDMGIEVKVNCDLNIGHIHRVGNKICEIRK